MRVRTFAFSLVLLALCSSLWGQANSPYAGFIIPSDPQAAQNIAKLDSILSGANSVKIASSAISGSTGAMQLIQAQIISADTAAVTFTVPQTFTNLKLIWSGASVANGGNIAAITVNGIVTGYVAQAITIAPAGSPAGTGGFNQPSIQFGSSFGEATFENYQNSISVNGIGGTDGAFGMATGYGTASSGFPITSIKLAFANGTHWISGTFSLYGIN